MTVSELIKRLQFYDPNMRVVFDGDYNEQYRSIVGEVTAVHKINPKRVDVVTAREEDRVGEEEEVIYLTGRDGKDYS